MAARRRVTHYYHDRYRRKGCFYRYVRHDHNSNVKKRITVTGQAATARRGRAKGGEGKVGPLGS